MANVLVVSLNHFIDTMRQIGPCDQPDMKGTSHKYVFTIAFNKDYPSVLKLKLRFNIDKCIISTMLSSSLGQILF